MYEKYRITRLFDDRSYAALYAAGFMGAAKDVGTDHLERAGAADCFYKYYAGHCGMARIVDGAFHGRFFQGFYDFTAEAGSRDHNPCGCAGDPFFPEKVHNPVAGGASALAGGDARLPDRGGNTVMACLYQGIITRTNDF